MSIEFVQKGGAAPVRLAYASGIENGPDAEAAIMIHRSPSPRQLRIGWFAALQLASGLRDSINMRGLTRPA